MADVTAVLNYLLALTESEEVGSMSRLAAFTVINKLFDSDKDCEIQANCLRKGIVATLVMTLDLGVSPKSQCDHADFVYICAAMETMWRLSKLPNSMIQCLNSEIVIRSLLAYLDVQGDFFVFPPKLSKILAKTCENKQLAGNVKHISMAPAPLEYIHRQTNNQLKCLSKLPNSLKVCRLFDTGGENEVDITQSFLQQKLAWPASNFPGDAVVDGTDDWQDVVVTKVINGGFFWAQVGENTIKEVCSIQEELNSGLQLERRPVSGSGELVIVHNEIQGTSAYLRAQVITTTGLAGQMIEVFLIDYGHILTVSDTHVFLMPEYFKNIPQKISLCTLEGIQAPPKDEELSINAAAILTNISKQAFPYAGEIICQLDGIGMIVRLLKSTNSCSLSTRLFMLLANIGRSKKLCGEFTESGIIPLLLEKLTDGARSDCNLEFKDDSEEIDYYEECILCLGNVMFQNPDCREKFYQSQGLDSVLQFLRTRVEIRTSLYRSIVKLLKIFVGSAVITDEKEPLPSKMGNKDRNTSPSQEQHKEQKPSCVRKPEVSTVMHSDDDSIPDTDRLIVPSTHPGLVNKSGLYVLESCVYISDDQRHELHPVTRVSNISSTVIIQVICGMVNSGRGGTIYFGVDKEGVVFGFELSRDEKDRFRLGIDQLMCGKIKPALLHSNFDFQAVPVMDKKKQEVIPDLFVIEIRVRGTRGVTYTTQDGKCYYRYGSATNSLTKVELRKLIAIEEEEYYRGEIERLIELKKKLLKRSV